ncbi:MULTISPECIES: L-threonylcarbamoyladenylate synthase [Paenibacillus]|uniref:Threonylcarbamoyl-AMP synthase n=1 Tax=Paenibacillus albilobatus TaxID=2716884 RepID=A0A920CBA4_9BACL|nr:MULTISPECIES: L-threonylcarbamoyladenylate synthase [Paenibacillus]GIO33160.1 threonylcarbamoyl-AMP synthase [Paenibacillus albilobatus]
MERTDQEFGTGRPSTPYWRIGPELLSDPAKLREELKPAAAILREGGVVAFPTETVYGLGADARSTAAVEAVFAAKGRPSDNPLIVHIANRGGLDGLVKAVSPAAQRLMDAFWPGPLTIVLPVQPGALSPRVTAGLDTVGIRMPDHPVALALIAESGCPVAAPSANRSGRPSPTLAGHVMEDLAGTIGGIVDGGATGVGVESTVVQVAEDGSVIVLRPGGVTLEQLSQAAGAPVRLDPALLPDAGSDHIEAPRAPGMKYTHYAPKGVLRIVTGPSAAGVSDWISRSLREAAARGERTGVLAFEEHIGRYQADCIESLGSLSDLSAAAHRLYAALRRMDEEGIGFILSEACPEEGLGAAIMNRLRKAAGQRVVRLG